MHPARSAPPIAITRPQISPNDVKVDETELNTWLQSDVYNSIVNDPEARRIFTDAGFRALLANDGFRAILANDSARHFSSNRRAFRASRSPTTPVPGGSRQRSGQAILATTQAGHFSPTTGKALLASESGKALLANDGQFRAMLADERVGRAFLATSRLRSARVGSDRQRRARRFWPTTAVQGAPRERRRFARSWPTIA